MLFLGYESAVQYWRAVRAGLVAKPDYSKIATVAHEGYRAKEVIECVPTLCIVGQFAPQILVSSVNHINRSDKARFRLCATELPEGSFCEHTSYTMVASPELCLLHAAKDCGPKRMIALVELCCEFMGCYSLYEDDIRGFVTCKPLVTKERMREYIGMLPKRTRGAVLLRRAVELSGERSWSPRETDCFMALTLPPEMGGFGLPQPLMNPFDEQGDGQEDSKDRFMVDLCWEERKTVFEYDGKVDHGTLQKADYDKERRSALASRGYKVIVAVKASVKDEESYRNKVGQVFGAMGLSMPAFSPRELDAQRALREALFDPSHYYETPYLTPIRQKDEESSAEDA